MKRGLSWWKKLPHSLRARIIERNGWKSWVFLGDALTDAQCLFFIKEHCQSVEQKHKSAENYVHH